VGQERQGADFSSGEGFSSRAYKERGLLRVSMVEKVDGSFIGLS